MSYSRSKGRSDEPSFDSDSTLRGKGLNPVRQAGGRIHQLLNSLIASEIERGAHVLPLYDPALCTMSRCPPIFDSTARVGASPCDEDSNANEEDRPSGERSVVVVVVV